MGLSLNQEDIEKGFEFFIIIRVVVFVVPDKNHIY